MTAVAIAVGLLVVHELGGVRSLDGRARAGSNATERRRDSVTWGGSMIADTYVKVPRC
jgi:hypothetical protein